MSKRILTVEDDPDILFIIEYILNEQGYEVFTSTDGRGILEQVDEVNPDLVLMDIRLPHADGRDLCKIIRERREQLPIILMSAHMDYSKGFTEDCANDFIAKPFDIDNFLKQVQKQLTLN